MIFTWLNEKIHTIEGVIAAVLTFIGSLVAFWKFALPKVKKGYEVGTTMVGIIEALQGIRKDMRLGFSKLEEGMLHQIGVRHAMANAEEDRVIFHADARGNFTWVSKAWERWTGSGTHSARGHGWELSVPEDGRAQILMGWQIAIDHERAFEGRCTLLNQSTRERIQVYISAEPIRNSAGKIIDYVGVMKRVDSPPTASHLICASKP